MTPLNTIEKQHNGYKIKIETHADEDMREPWNEHDGHGIVSDWETRDKRPGELILNSDRHSKRFYDVTATLERARKDGWGLSPESKAALAAKLGRQPTAKEVTAEAVRQDYEHLRGWCNDEWQWLGYTTQIETPDGETIDGASVWGMVSEATAEAESMIEDHQLTLRETAIAECCP